MNWLYPVLLVGLVATSGGKATSGVSSTVNAAVAPTTWADDMVAWWSMDQANPTNDAGSGTCGGTASNCNLTANGNYTTSSSIRVQGTAAGSMDGTGDYATCAGGTCTALNRSSSTTWGCFAYGSGGVMGRSGTPLYDYRILYDGLQFTCLEASAAAASTATATSSAGTSEWVSSVCVYDSGAAALVAYADGSAGTTTTSAVVMAASTNTFYIGNSFAVADSNFSGYIDDCFVYAGTMTATSVCRICSCGVDGSLCMCDYADTTAYANKGRNGSDCGSCTLPSCNAASPS